MACVLHVRIPNTPWDCHICLHWGFWGGQLIGIYGSPMECLGIAWGRFGWRLNVLTWSMSFFKDCAEKQSAPANAWKNPPLAQIHDAGQVYCRKVEGISFMNDFGWLPLAL